MKTIGFMPLRKNSKRIPGKNFRLFCGQPLFVYAAEALIKTVDMLVLATDCPEVSSVELFRRFNSSKCCIYHRSDVSATDTAPMEVVVREYLDTVVLDEDDVMIVAQATSPFTRSRDFYLASKTSRYPVFAGVELKKFIWYRNLPLYDHVDRPNSQNLFGLIQETGAFYINSVGNWKRGGRFYGGISLPYILPEWQAIDVDSETDWVIAESMMERYQKDGFPGYSDE